MTKFGIPQITALIFPGVYSGILYMSIILFAPEFHRHIYFDRIYSETYFGLPYVVLVVVSLYWKSTKDLIIPFLVMASLHTIVVSAIFLSDDAYSWISYLNLVAAVQIFVTLPICLFIGHILSKKAPSPVAPR